jgi:triosephosphate isomerase
MNKTFPEALSLVNEIKSNSDVYKGEKAIVIIAPPFPFIHSIVNVLKDIKNIYVAAQNCHSQDRGAYTGEVSAEIIRSTGAKYVIIGHSERRIYFKEENNFLLEKLKIALKNELTPIYCIGETLAERESNNHFGVLKSQLKEVLFSLDVDQASKIIIAYEPVWAIGTGVNASLEQAQEMHYYIRSLVKEKFGEKLADKIPILYGGSCNEKNAAGLFACKDVDGGLIGGASLNSTSFLEIIKLASV